MKRSVTLVWLLGLLTAASAPLAAQSASTSAYPNVDKPVVVAPGDTIRLLIRMVSENGPAMRLPGKRLDFVYSTQIPASDAAARQAQADRAAQLFGPEAVEMGVRKLSIGICDTRACAQRRDPPAEWYLYERTQTGWRRARS